MLEPPYAPDDMRHCADSVSPACIRALYGFDVADPNMQVSSSNSMGVFEEFSLRLVLPFSGVIGLCSDSFAVSETSSGFLV